MEIEFPERLYKYRQFNQFSLSMLIDRLVWAPKPKNLNDPFDIQVQYSGDPTVETMLKLVQKVARPDSDDPAAVSAMVKTAEQFETYDEQERKKFIERR